MEEGPLGKFLPDVKLKPLTEQKVGQVGLDPNHSHFILVDSHEEKKFGGEIKLRAELERAISTKWKHDSTG